MPRNVEENVYVTIAFARASPTWEYLQREATDLDISVAHLIKVLLADRTAALRGQDKQRWFPCEQVEVSTLSAPSPHAEPPEQLVGDETSRRAGAAASAASYWND